MLCASNCLAAAGASVLSLDLSEEQLATDRMVADRDGLNLIAVQGEMSDLSRFADASFDVVCSQRCLLNLPSREAQWSALASGDLHASLEVWPSGHAENMALYIVLAPF